MLRRKERESQACLVDSGEVLCVGGIRREGSENPRVVCIIDASFLGSGCEVGVTATPARRQLDGGGREKRISSWDG